MDTISVNQFRDNLKAFVEKVADLYAPLKQIAEFTAIHAAGSGYQPSREGVDEITGLSY
ncbi:MAG: hypothetical protein OQK94_10010 [Gammaproteobacteria bacterium]|nr:hypothetical protein [Gammaproteobacteria bacterium]MCW8972352.1 hypothetical protein [Gammaproteobacteria bacterium]MCW8992601.1 hypothetical protein [Gammaproteobacteria bacterium]